MGVKEMGMKIWTPTKFWQLIVVLVCSGIVAFGIASLIVFLAAQS